MTSRNRMNVSYQRNRDYSKNLEWTYELNNDVYDCYKRARNDPAIGYMKRLKSFWDRLHPEYDYLNEKQLRQQATFVEKKKLVLTPHLADVTEEGRNTLIEQVNANSTQNATVEDEQSIPIEENAIDQDLQDEIKKSFSEYYKKYYQLSVTQREYNCIIPQNITTQEFTTINKVITEHFNELTEPVDLWKVNVTQYAAILTLLARHNLLKEKKAGITNGKSTPAWLRYGEEKISKLQRQIAHVNIILDSRKHNIPLSHKQMKIQQQLKRKYGNLKTPTLTSKQCLLKHELLVESEKIKERKKIEERNSINKTFKTNQKVLYQNWKSKKIEVKDPPSLEEIQSFWKGIWSNDNKPYNENAQWLDKLKSTYCVDATIKEYEMTFDIFQQVLKNTKNNSAPGNDLIKCFWLKKLTSTHQPLFHQLKRIFDGEVEMEDWLPLCRTMLLPKDTDTQNKSKYRPIACLNVTYKLYTGMLYTFFEDHCSVNKIITTEQAGGKKGSWGCADQLLINKMILEEVVKHRRNIFTMWFDYRKAFDMIPHKWLLEAMKLAKIPGKLVNAVKNLMIKWSTKLFLHTDKDTLETEVIKYVKGLLQGDCLSLMLFILCVNPLSHLLNLIPGYKIGSAGKRNQEITHLFFVDDLKTFAQDKKQAKLQLDLITTFTDDIGMQFGSDKCAYCYIEKGTQKSLGTKFEINGLELTELKHGEFYKYLGQDESVSINGPLNKEKVLSEYYKRIKKIWSSELYARNKVNAHNTFALPLLTPTFGILNWTKDELAQIDIKTRKILCMTGSFHRNSDINRLYCNRNKEGRGLNSVVDTYTTRIISLSIHLLKQSDSHKYLKAVLEHENDNIMRQSRGFQTELQLDFREVEPREASLKAKEVLKEKHHEAWSKKPQHYFLFKSRKQVKTIDSKKTTLWLGKANISSHMEGYCCAIQEEEINTHGLKQRRCEDKENEIHQLKCRICHKEKESIQHVLACCPRLRIPMYLPTRHNAVAKRIYHLITGHRANDIQDVFNDDEVEVWWDVKIPTKTSVEHNKPDLVVWKKQEKRAYIVDVVVGLDVNVEKNENIKRDYYYPLSTELKRLYPDYTFDIIPISIGATGAITTSLEENITKIVNKNVRVENAIVQCQKAALFGSMKIVKSVMNK